MRGETKKKKENKDKINCVELRGVGVWVSKSDEQEAGGGVVVV